MATTTKDTTKEGGKGTRGQPAWLQNIVLFSVGIIIVIFVPAFARGSNPLAAIPGWGSGSGSDQSHTHNDKSALVEEMAPGSLKKLTSFFVDGLTFPILPTCPTKVTVPKYLKRLVAQCPKLAENPHDRVRDNGYSCKDEQSQRCCPMECLVARCISKSAEHAEACGARSLDDCEKMPDLGFTDSMSGVDRVGLVMGKVMGAKITPRCEVFIPAYTFESLELQQEKWQTTRSKLQESWCLKGMKNLNGEVDVSRSETAKITELSAYGVVAFQDKLGETVCVPLVDFDKLFHNERGDLMPDAPDVTNPGSMLRIPRRDFDKSCGLFKMCRFAGGRFHKVDAGSQPHDAA